MHKIILNILSIVFLSSQAAYSSDYDVSGYSGDGYVYGEIEAESGSSEVEGYLYDENGNEVYFEGEWSGSGEVEGYDENGNYIQLETD